MATTTNKSKPALAPKPLAQKSATKKTAAKKLAANAPTASAATKARKPKLVRSKLVYQGKVFNVFNDTLVEPNGHHHSRDVVRHNGSVVMLAVDESTNPADPDIILERQYRHAVGQFLLELPAGSRNPNEAPLAAAKRELIEETGFRAHRWTLLLRYFASPGFLAEWMQIYLARDLRPGIATPELDEQIEIVRLPLSQVLKLIADGKIHDGKTIIGLSLYATARHEGRL